MDARGYFPYPDSWSKNIEIFEYLVILTQIHYDVSLWMLDHVSIHVQTRDQTFNAKRDFVLARNMIWYPNKVLEAEMKLVRSCNVN